VLNVIYHALYLQYSIDKFMQLSSIENSMSSVHLDLIATHHKSKENHTSQGCYRHQSTHGHILAHNWADTTLKVSYLQN